MTLLRTETNKTTLKHPFDIQLVENSTEKDDISMRLVRRTLQVNKDCLKCLSVILSVIADTGVECVPGFIAHTKYVN